MKFYERHRTKVVVANNQDRYSANDFAKGCPYTLKPFCRTVNDNVIDRILNVEWVNNRDWGLYATFCVLDIKQGGMRINCLVDDVQIRTIDTSANSEKSVAILCWEHNQVESDRAFRQRTKQMTKLIACSVGVISEGGGKPNDEFFFGHGKMEISTVRDNDNRNRAAATRL